MPVYKRGDHYWVRMQIDGKLYRFSCKGATYEQAKAIEAKARQDHINESLGKVSYTLEDALARWLEGEASNLKSFSKVVQTVDLIMPHLEDTLITKAADAARKIREEYSHLSPATINRRLAIVRRLVNLAWEWGWIKSPIKISMQSGEVQRHEYLTISQVFRLAHYARRSRWHIVFAAFTGMREGEILNQDRFEDLGQAVALYETKNGKPRIVPLNRIARRALDNMDRSVTYATLRRDFEYTRHLSGLDHIRFHDLRHTAASLMIQGGADMMHVRDLLGHSNVAVTSRYSHLRLTDMIQAVDRMTKSTKTAQNSNQKKLIAA
jgi:integrase